MTGERRTPRPRPRALSWLQDYAYVAGLQGRYALAGPMRRREDPTVFEGGDGPPVLLLPGVYEPWTFLLPVARTLHDLGHPIFTVPALGFNRVPVDDGAALALQVVDERGLTDVVLVAHSKGGLIGKRMMITEAATAASADPSSAPQPPTGRIRSLVTVNTPFAGSRYATFLVGRTMRAFAPNNAALRALAAESAVNERITSVYAAFDPHIPDKSHLPGATNIELPLAGHFRPLADPLLISTITRVVDPPQS